MAKSRSRSSNPNSTGSGNPPGPDQEASPPSSTGVREVYGVVGRIVLDMSFGILVIIAIWMWIGSRLGVEVTLDNKAIDLSSGTGSMIATGMSFILGYVARTAGQPAADLLSRISVLIYNLLSQKIQHLYHH